MRTSENTTDPIDRSQERNEKMFKIEKRLASVSNVSLMIIDMPCNVAAETVWPRGAAVNCEEGTLVKCTGDDIPAEYIVAETCRTAGVNDTVKVYRILGDMVFRVPLTAYGAGVKVGNTVTFGSDSGSVTATVAESHGALIVNTLGASAAGDKILVMLK